MIRYLVALGVLSGVTSAARAQHGGAAGAATVAAPEARQFDFLVGQWELDVRPKGPGGLAERIHGAPRLKGSWKAWRAFDGFGIEDELRIIDESANPRSLTHTLRVYDPAAKRWSQTGLDVYRTRFASATAEWQGGEMRITSRGTDAAGKTVLSRSRFYEITPTGFRFQQDRSEDDGKTWTENLIRITAKRVAATAPR